MAFAWILSIPAVYVALGFLGNYYIVFFEIVLITIMVEIIVSLLFYCLLEKADQLYSSRVSDLVLALALFMVLSIFVGGMFDAAIRFPRLFDVRVVFLEIGQINPFLVGSVFALPILMFTLKQFDITQTYAYHYVSEIATGIAIAAFFFVVYFIFASIFNRPAFDVDDIFFDSDGLLWRTRFTTEVYRDYYWRSVHPFALLLIRPLVALVSFFLKGDKLSGAFVLIAFSGALCVFLTWFFVKRTVGNSLYASLIASLLGASAAHLVFGSLIETYIFLAAVIMIFLVLLLKDTSLFVLILTGLVSFGITITNFVQTVIALIFVRRDLKQWIKYMMIVGALAIPLALLNNFIYPNSQPYFFIPSGLSKEAGNTFTPSAGRGLAAVRVMFFHSIVAPDPLILREEIPFLKVWIFKADPMRLSEYRTSLGTFVAYDWLALLFLGGFLFLKDLKKVDNRFPFAFILILLFNFMIHLRYGKDLFLYSTNWVYALILFLAFAWKELADKRWFQIALLGFLVLLLANNSRLIFTMLSVSALHIK